MYIIPIIETLVTQICINNLKYGQKTKEEENTKDDEDFLEANRDLIGGSLHARVASMASNAHHVTKTVAKAILGCDSWVGQAPGLAAN